LAIARPGVNERVLRLAAVEVEVEFQFLGDELAESPITESKHHSHRASGDAQEPTAPEKPIAHGFKWADEPLV
jgi:hypothetical protein